MVRIVAEFSRQAGNYPTVLQLENLPSDEAHVTPKNCLHSRARLPIRRA